MEQRLRRENIGVFSFDLGGLLWRFNTRSITEQAQNIAEKIESICERNVKWTVFTSSDIQWAD